MNMGYVLRERKTGVVYYPHQNNVWEYMSPSGYSYYFSENTAKRFMTYTGVPLRKIRRLGEQK